MIFFSSASSLSSLKRVSICSCFKSSLFSLLVLAYTGMHKEHSANNCASITRLDINLCVIERLSIRIFYFHQEFIVIVYRTVVSLGSLDLHIIISLLDKDSIVIVSVKRLVC